MKPPMSLCVTSPFEERVSAKLGAEMWRMFLGGRESNHSGMAATLPYLVRRAERERVAYVITAYPGHGYTMRRGKPL